MSEKRLNEIVYLEDHSENWDDEYSFHLYEYGDSVYLTVENQRTNRPRAKVEVSEGEAEKMRKMFEKMLEKES